MSGEQIPPGTDLSTVPAMEAPDGQTYNFTNPEHRGPIYIGVASTFLSLATICVVLRLYARLIIQRKPWWDDCQYASLTTSLLKTDLIPPSNRYISFGAFKLEYRDARNPLISSPALPGSLLRFKYLA